MKKLILILLAGLSLVSANSQTYDALGGPKAPELLFTSATITSGTAPATLWSAQVDGKYAELNVEISAISTANSVGAFTVEESSDNVNWIGSYILHSGVTNAGAGTTTATSNREYIAILFGHKYVRLRLSANVTNSVVFTVMGSTYARNVRDLAITKAVTIANTSVSITSAVTSIAAATVTATVGNNALVANSTGSTDINTSTYLGTGIDVGLRFTVPATLSGGSVAFECSVDNTNFVPMNVYATQYGTYLNTLTVSSNLTYSFLFVVGGGRYVRMRVVSAPTGTGNWATQLVNVKQGTYPEKTNRLFGYYSSFTSNVDATVQAAETGISFIMDNFTLVNTSVTASTVSIKDNGNIIWYGAVPPSSTLVVNTQLKFTSGQAVVVNSSAGGSTGFSYNIYRTL